MNSLNRKSIFDNFLWRLAEKFGAKGVSFLVSILLARLLMPEEYGILSLITVFTYILSLFTDCHFSKALIQKKNADQLDFSTVFYFNVFMGLMLYGIMFIFAPAISKFYHKDYLISYIRILSLSLIIGSFKSIQSTIISIRMQFKLFFFSTIGGTIVSAIIGIWMAYHDMGVWALIGQQLTNELIDTLILWLTVRWNPSREFSIQRLKTLFQYGSKLLISTTLEHITNKISSLMIGRMYSPEELACYEKGGIIPSLIVGNSTASIQSILFPLMSQKQDDRKYIKNLMQRFLQFSCYLNFPAMVGMCVCSKRIILILYTEKWIMMTPYMKLACLSYLPCTIHIVNLLLLQAFGKSDFFLRLEVVKQVLTMSYLIAILPFGVLPMMIVDTVFSFVSIFINGYYSKRLIGYGILEQLKDLLPIVLLTTGMGIFVYFVGFLPYGNLLTLVLQILTGLAVYLISSMLFHLEIFYYILDIIKEVIRK